MKIFVLSLLLGVLTAQAGDKLMITGPQADQLLQKGRDTGEIVDLSTQYEGRFLAFIPTGTVSVEMKYKKYSVSRGLDCYERIPSSVWNEFAEAYVNGFDHPIKNLQGGQVTPPATYCVQEY